MTARFNEISDKVTQGVTLAVDRLIEQIKKENGELVVSENGKVVRIKARSIKK